MIPDQELLAVTPDSLGPESRAEYLEGLKAGLKNLRPQLIDGEIALVAELDLSINSTLVRPEGGPFFKGFEEGVELRLAAERTAIEVYKLLAGALPSTFLKRLLARPARLKRLLSQLGVLERRLIEQAYSQRYRVDLRAIIDLLFWPKTSQDYLGILDSEYSSSVNPAGYRKPGSEIVYSAQELSRALVIKTGPWPGQFFLGRTPDQRQALLEQFQAQYGPLKIQLEKHCTRFEVDLITDLVEHGRVSFAKLLYLCVLGLGTDEDGLHEILESMEPMELFTSRTEFKEIWRKHAPWYERPFPDLFGNLERRIWIETGGDCWFDLKEYFATDTPFPQNMSERLENLYAHERSGVLLKKIDFISREGLIMNQDLAKVRAFFDCFIKGLSSSRAASLRFQALVRYAEHDCEVFRAFKHFIGNLVTNVVATTSAATAGFSLGIYKIEIGLVMFCVGLTSISARIFLKILLKGRGYHPGEFFADLFFGVLDGVTLFTTYFFRQAALRFGTGFLTKLGTRTGFSRVSSLMGGDRSRRYKASLSELAGKVS